MDLQKVSVSNGNVISLKPLQHCKAQGCVNLVSIKSRGLCMNCYRHFKKYGNIDDLFPKMKKGFVPCLANDCDKEAENAGFCSFHYQRVIHGVPFSQPKKRIIEKGTKCKVEGCDREHHAKDYCKSHYGRLLKGRSLDKPIHKPIEFCKVKGCKGKHHAHGYCTFHSSRVHNKIPFDKPRKWKMLIGKEYIRRKIIPRLSEHDVFGCWFCVDEWGFPEYKSLFYQKQRRYVYKSMFMIHNPEIEMNENLAIRHLCSVRNCCNYQHMIVGTTKQNMRDKKKKNEHRQFISNNKSELITLEEYTNMLNAEFETGEKFPIEDYLHFPNMLRKFDESLERE